MSCFSARDIDIIFTLIHSHRLFSFVDAGRVLRNASKAFCKVINSEFWPSFSLNQYKKIRLGW